MKLYNLFKGTIDKCLCYTWSLNIDHHLSNYPRHLKMYRYQQCLFIYLFIYGLASSTLLTNFMIQKAIA